MCLKSGSFTGSIGRLANVGVPIALGGLWVYLVAGQLQKRPMLPVNDPYFKDMLLHGNQGGH